MRRARTRSRGRIVLCGLVATIVAGSVLPVPGARLPSWPGPEEVFSSLERAGEPIVLEFYRADCPYCARLHEERYADPAVARALASLRKARADLATERGVALGTRFEVRITPALVVTDVAGRVHGRFDGFPPVESLRALLDAAAKVRPSAPSEPLEWIAAGDVALDAGAASFASECYAKALKGAAEGSSEVGDSVRLRHARLLERLGKPQEAAAMLEPFTTATAPTRSTRPALDELIRLRRAAGDTEGERRAREAFKRLFPVLAPAH